MDGSAKQANQRLLTNSIHFKYANASLKHLQIDKTDLRSGKNHRHWFNGSSQGVISVHRFIGLQRSLPPVSISKCFEAVMS